MRAGTSSPKAKRTSTSPIGGGGGGTLAAVRTLRLVPVFLLVLTGCFLRGEPAPDPSGVLSIPPSSDARTFAANATSTLTIGTGVTRGVVSYWCASGDCEAVKGARPAGRIIAEDLDALATISLERAPLTLVAIHRVSTEVITRETLQPRTLAAWKVKLRPGIQQLRFVATWRDGETTWIFSVQGPKKG